MLKLVLTCGACPESYDCFDENGKIVAYLRLRHGHFTVHCPDVGGDLVYEADPRGDGIFDSDERGRYLKFSIDRIQRWIHNGCKALPEEPTPDVEFEMVGDPEDWGSGDFDVNNWLWESLERKESK